MTGDCHLLRCLAEAAKSSQGVTFEDRRGNRKTLSYKTLLQRALTASEYFKKSGIKAHQTVAIVLPTSPAFYDAFFGLLYLEAIPAPMYPPIQLGRIQSYILRTHAQLHRLKVAAVITDARCKPIISATSRSLFAGRHVIVLDDTAVSENLDKPISALPDLSAHQTAFIQLSSGTTGEPKPISLTHRQVLSNIDAFCEALGPSRSETGAHSCVSWLPLYHDMGLVGCMLAAVRQAARLTLLPPEVFVAQPKRWLQAMADERATISAAPDFGYALCTARIDASAARSLDLSAWRIALNGAEPINPNTLADFTRHFTPSGFSPAAMTPVYGLAEAGLAVTFSKVTEPYRIEIFSAKMLRDFGLAQLSDDPTDTSLVSVGEALPGYALRIWENGHELEDGHVGEIQFHGPSVCDWTETGDLGFIYDGELFVCGRKKDVIIIRGQNHAPQAIEAEIGRLDGVRTGCVVATSMPQSAPGSESLLILFEHRRDAPTDSVGVAGRKIAIQKCISEHFGLSCDMVVECEPRALPRTSSGKLQRRLAAAQWQNHTLRPPQHLSKVSLLWQILATRLKLFFKMRFARSPRLP